MSRFTDGVKNTCFAGVSFGAAALLMVPVLIPMAVQAARPLLKEGIKGGILCCRQGRDALVEVARVVDEAVAEARAELDAERPRERHASHHRGSHAANRHAHDDEPPLAAGEPSPEYLG